MFRVLGNSAVTSIRGGNSPSEATEAARVMYVLCACSVGTQAVVLRAVGEEESRVVGRQHGGPVVPPGVSQGRHQVQYVSAAICYLDRVEINLLGTRLHLHNRLKEFLKCYRFSLKYLHEITYL